MEYICQSKELLTSNTLFIDIFLTEEMLKKNWVGKELNF